MRSSMALITICICMPWMLTSWIDWRAPPSGSDTTGCAPWPCMTATISITGAGLREKVSRALRENGVELAPSRIVLITALRQFHYTSSTRPVSSTAMSLRPSRLRPGAGQQHLWRDSSLRAYSRGRKRRFFRAKAFHVSPFFPRRGRYEFQFSEPGEELAISITYFLDDKPALTASFTGAARPMTGRNLARMIMRHPCGRS
jgi:cyclopropane-fatty-acyl-phospholipid synthase